MNINKKIFLNKKNKKIIRIIIKIDNNNNFMKIK